MGVIDCRTSLFGDDIEVLVDTNAKKAYEADYWKGLLDAQGKDDGTYYWSRRATASLTSAHFACARQPSRQLVVELACFFCSSLDACSVRLKAHAFGNEQAGPAAGRSVEL